MKKIEHGKKMYIKISNREEHEKVREILYANNIKFDYEDDYIGNKGIILGYSGFYGAIRGNLVDRSFQRYSFNEFIKE